MKQSESIKELASALAKARGIFKEINKSKTVTIKGETKAGKPYEYGYAYADLPEIHDATVAALSEAGLSVSQGMSDDSKNVVSLLMHSSGEWISNTYPLIPKDEDMQSVGGAFTYSRRYGLNGLLNISSDMDTDGNTVAPGSSSSGTGPQPPKAKPALAMASGGEQASATLSNHAPGHKGPSEGQIKRFWAMTKQLGWNVADSLTNLKQKTGKSDIAALTWQEYKKYTDFLDDEIKEIKSLRDSMPQPNEIDSDEPIPF